MEIQHIILGIIKNRPMTGYEIKQYFDHSLAFFSGASYGSIYPTLKRLEKNGDVTVELEIQDGKPNRKIYTITDQGRGNFMEALASPIKLMKPKNDFLTRLFFFQDVAPEKRPGIVADMIRALENGQKQLQEIEPIVLAEGDQFQIMVYRFGLGQMKAHVEGVRMIEKTINQNTG